MMKKPQMLLWRPISAVGYGCDAGSSYVLGAPVGSNEGT